MEWTDDQVKKLKELCMAEVPNNSIAKQLNCDIRDVHNKRSQLGITRAKVTAMKQQLQSEPKKTTVLTSPKQQITKAFCSLHDSLLIAMVYDGTSEEDAKLYSCMAETVIGLSNVLTAARGIQ